MSKKVAVLGSTGSIGTNALDVISKLPKHLRVWGLSANTNWEALARQAGQFRPEYLSMADDASNRRLAEALPGMAKRVLSAAEFTKMAAEEADICLVAMVGAAGLMPSIATVKAGKRLAIANKESLVMAGALIAGEAAKSGAEVIPVDSEHSALFQAAQAGKHSEIARIILTASGGPFLDRPEADWGAITVEEALSHPTWSMGRKITIEFNIVLLGFIDLFAISLV